MKNLSLALLVFLSSNILAHAKDQVEHKHCKINELNLRNNNQFGSWGAVDLKLNDSQEILRLLQDKGYIHDEEFIREENTLNSTKEKSGLTINLATYISGYPPHEIYYSIATNGAEVTYTKNRKFLNRESSSSITVWFKELASDKKIFMRAATANDSNFVFEFARRIPECVVNPDVNHSGVIKR